MAETTYSNLIVQALEDQQVAVDALAAAKTAIAEAITAKGVSTPSTTKFNAMAAKINSIFQGRHVETGEITITSSWGKVLSLPLNFVPEELIMFTANDLLSSQYNNFNYLWQEKNSGGVYISVHTNSTGINVYKSSISKLQPYQEEPLHMKI